MKGYRAKSSPLKVEDYESLTEREKEELYNQIMAEEMKKREEEEASEKRLKMHRPRGGAY